MAIYQTVTQTGNGDMAYYLSATGRHVTFEKQKNNYLHMKKSYLFLFLITFGYLNAQDLGIGVRLGDPNGLTFKKYNGDKAWELSVGRTYWIYGRGWYDKNFNKWYDDQKYGYSDFQYRGYKSAFPIGMQLHYLIHKDIKKQKDEVGRMKWYYGIGGQLRFQNFYYSYRYKLNGDPNWYYVDDEKVTNIDLGVDGIIGLEYTFKDAPVSLFLDGVLFLEVLDAPFLLWWQGGCGIRVNIK